MIVVTEEENVDKRGKQMPDKLHVAINDVAEISLKALSASYT